MLEEKRIPSHTLLIRVKKKKKKENDKVIITSTVSDAQIDTSVSHWHRTQ